MNEADIKKLPKEEQKVLKEEGIDKWHEKFCVDVKAEKLIEPQWIRKADWKEHSSLSITPLRSAEDGSDIEESLGYFLMNTIDGLTLNPNGYNIGCIEVIKMEDGDYDFRRITSGTLHIDKSEEMLKVLRKAFNQAKKELKGKGATTNEFFCTMARLSGYLWDTTGEMQYAWYEKYGIGPPTIVIETDLIPIHAEGYEGRSFQLSPRDYTRVRQQFYCLQYGLKPSYVFKDIENNK